MDRLHELRTIHQEFLFLYLGHSLSRQMADAARNIQAHAPDTLSWLISNSRERGNDWLIISSLILDSLAYSYDSMADEYFRRMEENQALFRQVTAHAETELAALMTEAREIDQRHADASCNANRRDVDQDSNLDTQPDDEE